MNTTLKLIVPALVLAGFTSVSNAASTPVLVNSSGSPIMGENNLNSTANDNGNPTEYNYSNEGFINIRSNPNDGGTGSNLVDGNTSTYDDAEYDGNLPAPLNQRFDSAFVGLLGSGLLTASSTTPYLRFNFRLSSMFTATLLAASSAIPAAPRISSATALVV